MLLTSAVGLVVVCSSVVDAVHSLVVVIVQVVGDVVVELGGDGRVEKLQADKILIEELQRCALHVG